MAMNRTVVVIFALALGLLAACDPGMEAPVRGLELHIAAPKGADNPFADKTAAFVTMTVLGPDIAASQRPSVTAPWQPGGTLELNGPDNDIPFGKDRQVQVSLHPCAQRVEMGWIQSTADDDYPILPQSARCRRDGIGNDWLSLQAAEVDDGNSHSERAHGRQI